MTFLEKFAKLLEMDKFKIFANSTNLDFRLIDDYLVISEAIYESSDNISGLSFTERYKILTNFLNLKSEPSFWLNSYPNESKYLKDDEHLYLLMKDRIIKEISDSTSIEINLRRYNRR